MDSNDDESTEPDDGSAPDTGDGPSWRQRLHAATGDRDAEADALADRSDEDVTERDARIAVLRVRGEDGVSDAQTDQAIANPDDARSVADEREGDDEAPHAPDDR